MSLLNTCLSRFEALGFDTPKFFIGLQTAFAAYIALLIAWSLGLEHPQWAAITTFVTLQPSRGQIIEKSIWRFGGSILGCCCGALVAVVAGGDLRIELLLLSAWAGLTVFAGSLQRSYRSYATVLAGYSAIIVIVLSPYNPVTVQDVALDRILTVLIGAFCGVVLAYMRRLQHAPDEYHLKVRRLTADILQLAGLAQQDSAKRDVVAFGRMIRAAAMLQEDLHTLTATGRGSAPRRLEPMLQALTALLFAAYQHAPHPALGMAMEGEALRLHGRNDFAGFAKKLHKLVALCDDPVLEETLITLTAQVSRVQDEGPMLAVELPSRSRYALDWAGAFQGAIRIFSVLLVISLGWVVTGLAEFQYAMVSAAIAMALTTTGVTPARKMRDVLKGQLLAALLALVIACWLWPIFPSPTGQLLCLVLPALAFAFIRAHRKTSLSAADFSITVFLLLSPSYGTYAAAPPYLAAFMAVAGGVLGIIAYYLIFPTDARVRRKALWRMVKRDLQEVALSRRVPLSSEAWRQSFATRFLKIVYWAALEGGRYEREAVTLHKGFVTMALAEAVFALKRLQHRAALPGKLRQLVELNLTRIGQASKESNSFLRALDRLAAQLIQADYPSEARLLRGAVAEMRALQTLRQG